MTEFYEELTAEIQRNQNMKPLDDPELAVCEDFLTVDCHQDFVREYGYKAYYRCLQYTVGFYEDYGQYKQQMTAKFVLYGCILHIVCVTGTVGNLLSFYTLRKPGFRASTTAVYLQALMLADTLFLLANYVHNVLLIGLGLGHFMLEKFPMYSRAYINYNVINVFKNCSILLTLAVTIERYICVCHSLHAAKISTMTRSRMIVFLAVAVSVVNEIPRTLILQVTEVEQKKDNGTTCPPLYLVDGAGLISQPVEQAIDYLGTALFLLLPLVLLSILTARLLTVIKKSRKFRGSMYHRPNKNTVQKHNSTQKRHHSNDTSTTVVLIAVVITYLVCTMPNAFIVVLRLSGLWDKWYQTLPGSICHYTAIVLVNINSAVNFLLFCFFGNKFRKIFYRTFTRCDPKGRQGYPNQAAMHSTITASLSGTVLLSHPPQKRATKSTTSTSVDNISL